MTESGNRRIQLTEVGDVTVVTFVDKKIWGEHLIPTISAQLFAVVDDGGRRKILLNFANVDKLSSAAFGALIRLKKRLRELNGDLKLCHVAPEIRRDFELTSLEKVFAILPDEPTALAAFG